MASHSFRRSRVLVFAVLAALALAAVMIGIRASGGATEVAKAKCPSGFIPAEQDIVERYERSKGIRSEEGEREEAGGGVNHSTKYCMNINHPEMPEDVAKFGEAAGLRFGGERPGEVRRALRQKAHLADSSTISGANGTWQPLGKGPLVANDPDYAITYGEGFGLLNGRISDYAYDAGTGRLWATVAQGGVWESTDRGANWFTISDGQNGLPMQSTGGIAWTPAGGDGGTLVVLTGDHAFSNDYAGMGAYYTTDDGVSWHHASGIPDGALSFQVAVDPTNAKRLYAATGLGLYRSDDAGRTWENVKLPTGDCAGKTTETNCFFANVVTSVQVQGADKFSHKGGAVAAAVGWRAGKYPNFNDKPQAPANGIYVSDTGATGSFTKIGDDAGITPTDEFGRAELGAANGTGQNTGFLYAIVQNSKFFTDGNDLGDPDAPACEPTGNVCPASGSVVDGVYVSSDFGKTWTQMEGHDEFANDVTSGSAITQLRPLGISAGYQVTYNEWIKVDPTQQNADGVPTHLLFGMEEIWQNRFPGQALDGKSSFDVIGPYASSGACIITLLADPCAGAQSVNPQGNTTHPDQHGALILPAKKGVDLIAGNDGGNYVQHSDDGSFKRNAWGAGSQGGFHTLLPYGVAMAKDRTVWAGLQDNGEMKIDPKTGVQTETYGGDGVFTLVNPDNSSEAVEEYPGASISVTKDGGHSWSDMSPYLDDADFVTPLVQDPDNYKHIVTGGRQIVETTAWLDTTGNCYKDPGKSDETPDCLVTESPDTDWQSVFDLGTQQNPGKYDAEASDADPGNHVISLRARGAAVYAGFCGSCDPVKLHDKFHSGIATNVGGSKPPKTKSPDGWHIASAKGLPQRIITGVEIDPKDAKTVYVTLGSSAARPFAPLGSLGEDATAAQGGYVYVSHDAGESFTDITGNLPKIQATWVRVKGNQIVVSDAIGMFISEDLKGGKWAPLGSGFPSSPVYSFELEPGDANKIVVASFGRGVWEYDFTARKAGSQGVLNQQIAGGKRPHCGDHAGPTSRFYPNIKKAAKRRGKGLVLAGTSAFKRCRGGAAGKVKRVVVALKLQVTKKKFRYLTKKGKLSKARSCKRKAAYFTDKGTTKWTFKVKGPLPVGKYLAQVRARDNIGNAERQTAHRNFRHFRLTAKAAKSGWYGRQPNTVK